jgi:hypothetical protein
MRITLICFRPGGFLIFKPSIIPGTLQNIAAYCIDRTICFSERQDAVLPFIKPNTLRKDRFTAAPYREGHQILWDGYTAFSFRQYTIPYAAQSFLKNPIRTHSARRP